jgi:hypothetical protein
MYSLSSGYCNAYQGDHLVKQVRDINTALDGVMYGINRIARSHSHYGGTTKASYSQLKSYNSAQKLPRVNPYLKHNNIQEISNVNNIQRADSTLDREDNSHRKNKSVYNYDDDQTKPNYKSKNRVKGNFFNIFT